MDPVREKEIEEEYLSSLMDLNVNSKPLINMLTMLADENLDYAHVIVKAVEKHLAKVSPDVKLPILYLIDSIVKNVGKNYKQLFAQNIVNMFCGVFEKVNEKVREKMFNLRQTWNEVFPQTKLYALDVKVNVMDNNWPITAKVVPKSVHVNPNFLKNKPPSVRPQNSDQEELLNQMKAKERELIELKQRKIELELMVTKKKIAESEREMRGGIVNSQAPPIVMPNTMPNIATNHTQRMLPVHHQQQGRVRIAPANADMIAAARSRDPRLMRARPPPQQHSTNVPLTLAPIAGMSISKSMPRIPKFSHANNNKTSRNDDHDRDPRNRRHKEKDDKSNKFSPKDRHKDKAKSSSSRSGDHKKSGSSDDSSPRKKGDDDKKSPKISSSRHRSRSRSSPSKSSQIESKDVDLRLPTDLLMKPDSTTHKDKLLNNMLNGEDMKSSHEMMIASDDNEEIQAGSSKIRDTDLRFIEGGKKRSLSAEPSESEPTNKKNRAEDLLFGNKDVDLRNIGEAGQSSERRGKSKEKADFEAVRAKLNATKEKSRLRPGIKILDEFPAMPASENGNVELMKKILGRKEKNRDFKELEEIAESPQIEEVPEVQPPPQKQSRFNPIQPDEKMEDVADLGNLTAAELRKSSLVPASIRKDKRKGSKWNQPEKNWPNTRQPINPVNLTSTGPMMPQHFINPWESSPMIKAMQKQSQMPLVVPQSISHPVLNTKLRTLRLDGTKDHLLRFYHETAIIFNEHGDPHDIKFSAGQSRVIIDDHYTVDLNFNDSYKPVFIESKLHQIKFGSPTRELYIDHHFYECYFNNQPTQIVLNEKIRMIRIEGNAPEVKIGRKRNDLVLGLINIVIDAEVMVPIFLDTSIQYFEFKGEIFTLQFADFFYSVVINDEAFKVEYGGLPKNYTLNGHKHFIRFTGFPDEFTPGRVNMKGMRRTHLFRNCKSPPMIMPLETTEGVDIGQLVENDMRGQPQTSETHMVMPSSSSGQQNAIPGFGNDTQGAPALNVPSLDINDLLKKLVATGIIGGAAAETPSTSKNNGKKEKTPERPDDSKKARGVEEKKAIIPVSLSRPDTLKRRQNAIVDTLYLGIQCSSCGLRFPPEQTMKYSQHLDWHFRQNRRERDSKRRAHFRKWYYNQSDWIKYEEIEDLEERDKNFFETQQMESMGDDSNNAGGVLENSAEVSCPAGPLNMNHICEVCHDEFDQFFDEETEEWHLRSALKVEDKFFHPICYEDFKASLTLDETALNEMASNEMKPEDEDEEMAEELVIKSEPREIKSFNSITGDDDDDVIVLPPEEQVVTEIMDESEVIEEKIAESNGDDDVVIQEPKIDTQVVPDDDDDDYQKRSSTSAEPFTDNFIVKIKEEPKDDGYEDLVNEEDAFVEVTAIASDDHLHDEAYTNSPKAPFQPAQDENAIFDEASLVMMTSPSANDEMSRDSDYENNSRPESSGAPLIGGNKKLKIVLSSLAQTNLTNKNYNSNSNVIDQNENSNLDSVNKLDSNSVELQSDGRKDNASTSEEPEIKYQVKPQLQGVKFERNFVPVKRGLENSGLCSIM